MKKRRSIYAISDKSLLSDEEIKTLVGKAVLHVPSAFNGQSARVALLFGEAHQKLWKIVEDALRAIVPADKFAATEEKIKSFAAGHGTVLYFNDTAVTENLMAAYPLYKDNFPIWAQQGAGMLQYAIWVLFADAGLGASLQHYNPLIDAKVRSEWNIPSSWQLLAEMPFGAVAAPADEKEFEPLDKRLLAFGK